MGCDKVSRPLSSEISLELGFSFNTRLWKNIELLRNATLNQDFDCVVLVDGNEGAGKSVFGMQVAYALDKYRSIDLDKQVCWYPEQVHEAITSLEPGRAIVWDEARRGLNRRRSTQDVNMEVTDLLAECRQNNLFLVVIMPSFYDMDMNVAVWRSRLLLHVWYDWDIENREKPLSRGKFRMYSEKGKKRLYTDKNARMGYHYPFLKGECFDASFPHHYVVDELEYRRLKKESEEKYRKKNKSSVCEKCGKTQLYYRVKSDTVFCRACGFKKKVGAITHKKSVA